MTRYRALAGETGVTHYENGPACIQVRFQDGSVYRYTVASAGQEAIDTMQTLAEAGRGLTTFISQQVREKYEEREK